MCEGYLQIDHANSVRLRIAERIEEVRFLPEVYFSVRVVVERRVAAGEQDYPVLTSALLAELGNDALPGVLVGVIN